MVEGFDSLTQRAAVALSRRNMLKGTIGAFVATIGGARLFWPVTAAADCCNTHISDCSACTTSVMNCSCDLSYCGAGYCFCNACNCTGDGEGYNTTYEICDSGSYGVWCNKC